MPALSPKNLLVVGLEHGGPLRRSVWPWLDRLGLLGPVELDGSGGWENVRGIAASPYLVARNRAVRDIILPLAGQYEWVLMINNDVTPTESSAKFLALETDLASCRCPFAGNPQAWSAPEAFHTALCLVRMQVFRVMEPPWFRYVYTNDGCGLVACDCRYFTQRAMEAGFTVAHDGVCGHDHQSKSFCLLEG